MKQISLLCLPLFFCFSCDTSRPAFSDYAMGYRSKGGPVLTESLFDYKEKTISELDIPRILDGQIVIPDSIRLAVFQYGGTQSRYGAWSWYDEENLRTQQLLMDTFQHALRQTQRVEDVLFLPSIVTGSRPNIFQLRESAVRLQADVLLVFTLHSDLFRKVRAFKKDEARAFATCEVVLMDVRTGIIPHTNMLTRSAQSVKERADFSQEEHQRRALSQASVETLLEAGLQASRFLDSH